MNIKLAPVSLNPHSSILNPCSFLNPFKVALLFFFLLLTTSNTFAGMATLSSHRPVQDFINQMVAQYNFDGPNLSAIFQQVRIQNDILSMMKKPKESSPWYSYRNFFVNDKRISEGVEFWNQHQQALAEAQKKYGVPASVIVAIIGVETNYGKVLGRYRVIDALSTLAFYYPPRQDFFRNELAQYLLLSRDQGFDPLQVNGSYAGAMGMPQFMPSSYRKFAVSPNGREANLWKNSNDAIFSVANYFKNYGWQAGEPIAVLANVNDDSYRGVLSNDAQPDAPLGLFAKRGITPAVKLAEKDKNDKAALIRFQTRSGYEYWLVFNNFNVITQYNTSLQYAMAVYELSQRIQAAKNG